MIAQHMIRRTLLLGCGVTGHAVCQAVDQLLPEWGAPPVVKTAMLTQNEGAGEEVDRALHEISQLRHRTALPSLGYRLDELEQLVIWVVAGTAEEVSLAARMAFNRARAALSTDPFLLGLVLQEGLDDSEGPERVTEREEQPWLLDAPCYRVMLLNEVGLTVGSPEDLVNRAATFLVLHTCTPLYDSVNWTAQGAGWDDIQTSASFGVVSLVWPAEIARSRAAAALRRPMANALLEGQAKQVDPEVEHLGRSRNATLNAGAVPAPGLLGSGFAPEAFCDLPPMTDELPPAPDVWDALRPADGGLPDFLQHLHDTLSGWAQVLDTSQSAWAQLRSRVQDEATERLRMELLRVVEREGVAAAHRSLDDTVGELTAWAEGAEQRSEEAAEDAESLLAAADKHWQRVLTVLEAMPKRSFWGLLPFLWRPGKLLRCLVKWRKLQAHHEAFVQLRAARCAAQVTEQQMCEAARLYRELVEHLEGMAASLSELAGRISKWSSTDTAPPWPQAPLLLADDLESVLQELMARVLPSPCVVVDEFMSRWGSLATWLDVGMPEEAILNQWLEEIADPIAQVPIWDVLAISHPSADQRREWLKELKVQALPFWRWDTAILSDVERAHVGRAVVGLIAPQGRDVLMEDPSLREVFIIRQDRLAVVTLLWGIPHQTSGGELELDDDRVTPLRYIA